MLSLCSKDRNETHAQYIVSTLLLASTMLPMTFPTRVRRAVDLWTRQLVGGASAIVAHEGVACTLLHKLAVREEDKVTQHLLLHSVLTAADNNLLVAEPSLDIGMHASVHASGAPPFAWMHVCSNAGAGQHLEGMYDSLCALLLHIPSYKNAHSFMADTTCAFALHVWRCILLQHPVGDAGFLSEALPALLALAAARPGPVAQLAQQAVQLTMKEQACPGFSSLQRLLLEFPALRSGSPAGSAAADSLRTVPVFFPEEDPWWQTYTKLDAQSFEYALSSDEWLPELRRALIQHLVCAETDCPRAGMHQKLQEASSDELSSWCSQAVCIALHSTGDSAEEQVQLGVVQGNTVAGVSTFVASGQSEEPDADAEQAAVDITMDEILGSSSLQTALRQHAARLPQLQQLAQVILQEPVALHSSPSFALHTHSEQEQDKMQLGGTGWPGLPDLVLSAQAVRAVADGTDRADSSQLQQSGAALVSVSESLRISSSEAGNLDGEAGMQGHISLLGSSPIAGASQQERCITSHARRCKAAAVDHMGSDQLCMPLLVSGDDATVGCVLSGLLAAQHKNTQLFSGIKPQVYLLPPRESGSASSLAEYLAFVDPWYRRFVFGPFRGDCVTLPQVSCVSAGSVPATQAHSNFSPFSVNSFLVQDFLRSSFCETKLRVWQVECWLPSSVGQAGKRQSRVAAMGSRRQDGRRLPKEAASGWQAGEAPFQPPDRPADLLIPMFMHLELGMSVLAKKATTRGSRTWWAGLAQAVAPGNSLSTPEVCVEASTRRLGQHASAAANTIHSQGRRLLRLRVDNCPSVVDMSRQAAVSAVTSSADLHGDESDAAASGPTAHSDFAAGVAGDEAERVTGGAAYAAEVGSLALPSDPWLNLSVVADGPRTSAAVQQAVKAMPTISNESAADPGIGRKLADAISSDEQRSLVNRLSLVSHASMLGSTAAAAGSGMDLIVDGVLFASDFSAIRVSPLALEDGAPQHQIVLRHPM